MVERTLPFPPGYDPESQKLLGTWAAQLDAQSALLSGVVRGLDAKQLEWQPGPGHNSIGMLLAHIAIVEFHWLRVSAAEVGEDGEGLIRKALGVGPGDDGIPLPEGGGHPKTLAGWSLEQYLDLLTRARAETHGVLRSWRDEALDQMFSLGEHRFSRSWTVYHLLEHFACHLGQIRVLRRAVS